jgi:hypothetical protein
MTSQFLGDLKDCIYCERTHHTDESCNTILLKELIGLLKERK